MLSFSLDLIQNATKNGYDKIYLANLHGQRYPDGHFVVATRVDKQWHLWEPDFRGNETRAALSNILEKSPVSTAVTIYNPEEIAREGIRYVWEENDIAVIARFELPTLFRQDFDF